MFQIVEEINVKYHTVFLRYLLLVGLDFYYFVNFFLFSAEEIVYQDSTDNALSQLDLLAREIYLPLLCSEQGHATSYGMSADKLDGFVTQE